MFCAATRPRLKCFLAEGKRVDFVKPENKVLNLNFRKTSFQITLRLEEEDGGTLPNGFRRELEGIISGKTLQLEIGCHTSYVWDENIVIISSSDSCLKQFYEAADRKGLVIDAVLAMKNFGLTAEGNANKRRSKYAITEEAGSKSLNRQYSFAIEWKGFYFSDWNCVNGWGSTNCAYDGELELFMTLTAKKCGCHSPLMLTNVTNMITKILKEPVKPDLSIVPSTGKTIPCHRMFLIAHSPAFDNIIKGTFGDAEANKLQMPELSEAGAQALIEYMYFGDISKPEENCTLALELYRATQKYEINGLKDTMSELFKEKADNWYKVEMLMQFYSLVRNNEADKDLKTRAVKLIKTNFKTIQQSSCYHNFYKDDLEGAKELVSLLLN